MLVGAVGLLNVSMHVLISMILVCVGRFSFTSVRPCGLRCRLKSSREHNARSGYFITPFEKFWVG